MRWSTFDDDGFATGFVVWIMSMLLRRARRSDQASPVISNPVVPDDDDPAWTRVDHEITRRRMISAIALARAAWHLELRPAKALIDSRAEHLRRGEPSASGTEASPDNSGVFTASRPGRPGR